MTIPEACRLVMEAATMSKGNQIFVFDMGESVKIVTLAKRMIELAGLVPGKDIEIAYTNTGFFEVDTKHLYLKQNPTNYTCACTSTNLGTNSAMIGETSIESGVFLFPVLAKNEEVEIVIRNNSYLPSIFSSLHWLGDLNVRGQ
jgi:hypothetical protein